MLRRETIVAGVVVALATAAPRSAAHAQRSAVPPAASPSGPAPRAVCDYASCALGIVPRWNGLAAVRPSGEAVATLGFFWPRDVGDALAGSRRDVPGADSVRAQASAALRLRRVGATLTDGGALLLAGATLAGMRARHVGRGAAIVGGVGLAAFAISVPFQFAADGALSRAVWWHNVRYAR